MEAPDNQFYCSSQSSVSFSRSALSAYLRCHTREPNPERRGNPHTELFCHRQPHPCGCVDEGSLRLRNTARPHFSYLIHFKSRIEQPSPTPTPTPTPPDTQSTLHNLDVADLTFVDKNYQNSHAKQRRESVFSIIHFKKNKRRLSAKVPSSSV